MKKKLMTALIPPLSVYRCGCARYCTAPVSVFWVTGLISIFYGFMGGPGGLEQTSWMTVLLGVGLWGIAAVWAENTIKCSDSDPESLKKKGNKTRNFYQMVSSHLDESDPFEEIKKLQ